MKKVLLDETCQNCFADSVYRLGKMLDLSEERTADLAREARRLAAEAPADWPPPRVARVIDAFLRKHLPGDDLFRPAKEQANRHAAAVADDLRRRIAAAPDPFALALRIALAGNVIDFAYRGSQDLPASVDRMTAQEPAVDDTARLRAELAAAKTVLYLTDNAGEIWCDRLLIETFPAAPQVVVAVRDKPALNDATLAAAHAAGLPRIARVISSGSDAPGALLDLLNDETRRLLREAEVVISKGQGNFESLYGRAERPIYFLFLVKCAHVEKTVGQPVGSGMIWRWQPER